MWRLETTSNELDPDFDWSAFRLSRHFCRNLGDLQQKKKVFTVIETVFLSKRGRSPNNKKNKKKYKNVFIQAETQFLWSISHQVFEQLSTPIPLEGLFLFLVQKFVSKVLKTGYFAYSSGQWGKLDPLLPPRPLWLRYSDVMCTGYAHLLSTVPNSAMFGNKIKFSYFYFCLVLTKLT